jgi:hypothetical protein
MSWQLSVNVTYQEEATFGKIPHQDIDVFLLAASSMQPCIAK